jgi:hypothetical protein
LGDGFGDFLHVSGFATFAAIWHGRSLANDLRPHDQHGCCFLAVAFDGFCAGAEFGFNDNELDAEQLSDNHKQGY